MKKEMANGVCAKETLIKHVSEALAEAFDKGETCIDINIMPAGENNEHSQWWIWSTEDADTSRPLGREE